MARLTGENISQTFHYRYRCDIVRGSLPFQERDKVERDVMKKTICNIRFVFLLDFVVVVPVVGFFVGDNFNPLRLGQSEESDQLDSINPNLIKIGLSWGFAQNITLLALMTLLLCPIDSVCVFSIESFHLDSEIRKWLLSSMTSQFSDDFRGFSNSNQKHSGECFFKRFSIFHIPLWFLYWFSIMCTISLIICHWIWDV